MIPACCCKGVACINPWMYAINHPRYRYPHLFLICPAILDLITNISFTIQFSLELQKKMPWFCVHEPEPVDNDSQGSGATEKSIVAASS